MNSFAVKFKLAKLTIYSSKFWIWSVRPNQPTVGSTILSLRRDDTCFANISHDEACDYANILKIVEKTTKAAFDFDVINYLTLMMIDKQLHTHIIPRYHADKFALNQKWSDPGWPGQPDLQLAQQQELDALEIQQILKNHLITN